MNDIEKALQLLGLLVVTPEMITRRGRGVGRGLHDGEGPGVCSEDGNGKAPSSSLGTGVGRYASGTGFGDGSGSYRNPAGSGGSRLI